MSMNSNAVKVSPKFQVVIPKAVRRELKIRPGQRLQVLASGGTIRLVPVQPIEKLRGFAKGLPAFDREPDRRP